VSELVSESIRRIMDDELSVGDLAIYKILRRPLPTYARAIPHVSAAIMRRQGALLCYLQELKLEAKARS